jgi:hypothetical protein
MPIGILRVSQTFDLQRIRSDIASKRTRRLRRYSFVT